MINSVLEKLEKSGVSLSVTGDNELSIKGKRAVLNDAEIIDLLRSNKELLVKLIKSGQYEAFKNNRVAVAANGIPPDCDAITPEMLTLVKLDEAQIERLVGAVPGGARNIQDAYPLTPLQDGMLFHVLLGSENGGEHDPFLMSLMLGFDSRERLDAYLSAMQSVIARHDALRSAVQWEGLPEPVQVVWREAPLVIEEVGDFEAGIDVAEQLYARFNPRHYRIDIRQAPLLRAQVAPDGANDRWVLLLLYHHLTSDHVTLEVLNEEIQAYLQGTADRLPAPLAFRELVGQ
ncbi:condensation domain-containing protein, partial [Trinickia mobilis]|uniref:condensation domain-containing protein n=1 Tax=Trinickia mobilis TaxID=2816356 RepID=UPI001F5DFE2F